MNFNPRAFALIATACLSVAATPPPPPATPPASAVPATPAAPVTPAIPDTTGTTFEIDLSQGSLQRLFAWQTSEVQPVNQFSMGSWVSGSSNIQGQNSVALMADANEGSIDVMVNATADTSTLATNQPRSDITIYATMSSETSVATATLVQLESTGFVAYATQANADTQCTVDDVEADASGLFWRIKQNIAENQAWEQIESDLPDIEQSTSSTFAQQFQSQIDSQLQTMLTTANASLQSSLLQPFQAIGQTLQMSSTTDHLSIGTTAPNPNAASIGSSDLVGTMSEAVINRLLAAKLAGQVYSEADFYQLFHIQGTLSAGDAAIEITFPAAKPMEVTFGAGSIQIVMRSAGYSRGTELFPPMNVMAVYQVTQGTGTSVLQRTGDLSIYPPRDESNINATDLTLNEKALKTILKAKLEAVLGPTLTLDQLPLPGGLVTAGQLQITSITAQPASVAFAGNIEDASADAAGTDTTGTDTTGTDPTATTPAGPAAPITLGAGCTCTDAVDPNGDVGCEVYQGSTGVYFYWKADDQTCATWCPANAGVYCTGPAQ